MMTTRRRRTASNSGTEADNGSSADYRADLWKMADALRGSMDAAEYKHVVLGLIFLKYISDAFEERHAQLMAEVDEGADPEEPDEYRAESIFWVPQEARWPRLQALARQPRSALPSSGKTTPCRASSPRTMPALPWTRRA